MVHSPPLFSDDAQQNRALGGGGNHRWRSPAASKPPSPSQLLPVLPSDGARQRGAWRKPPFRSCNSSSRLLRATQQAMTMQGGSMELASGKEYLAVVGGANSAPSSAVREIILGEVPAASKPAISFSASSFPFFFRAVQGTDMAETPFSVRSAVVSEHPSSPVLPLRYKHSITVIMGE
nr:hypothetical protein Iba_chr09cCG11320 [Ipomoea batatas]